MGPYGGRERGCRGEGGPKVNLNVGARETGQVWFRQHDDGRLEITSADPRVAITPELLDNMTEGRIRWGTVTGEQLDVVTLTDDFGKRLIYRLGEFDAWLDRFYMEWPD